MDAAAIARACADAVLAEDATGRDLGIKLISVAPGQAVLGLTVAEKMVNWHDTCHGGFIFLLADSAFGYACQTYNNRMVAQHCNITYLNPAQRGDSLRAHAVERQRAGRNAIYDVTVTRTDGLAIAEFRGSARIIEGRLLPDDKA